MWGGGGGLSTSAAPPFSPPSPPLAILLLWRLMPTVAKRPRALRSRSLPFSGRRQALEEGRLLLAPAQSARDPTPAEGEKEEASCKIDVSSLALLNSEDCDDSRRLEFQKNILQKPAFFSHRNHGSTLLAAASTTTPLPLLPLPVRASSVPIESSREERHSSKEEEEEQARAAILAAASASSAASLSRRGSADSSCACLQASAEATDGWTQLL